MFGAKAFVIVTGMVLVLLVQSCNKQKPNSSNAVETQAQSQTPSPQQSPLSKFDADLQYVRNGQYTYVWVFSRKDGKVLDKDDAAYLRKNAPQVVDWVGTDEGKKFIAGTNFDLEQGNMELLKKRFVVEDYSGR
jgi:hypothetical protein